MAASLKSEARTVTESTLSLFDLRIYGNHRKVGNWTKQNSNKWEIRQITTREIDEPIESINQCASVSRENISAIVDASRSGEEEMEKGRELPHTSSVKHRSRWVSKEGRKGRAFLLLRLIRRQTEAELSSARLPRRTQLCPEHRRVPCEFRRKNNERSPRRFAETDLPSCCIARYTTRECT